MLHWPTCLGCFSTRDLRPLAGLRCHQLCLVCRNELDELRCPPQAAPWGNSALLDITGLFFYQGVIRRLILRAKVGGDLQALQLILLLVDSHPAGQAVLEWADALMPCASSLWGRVRGRLDIAGQIAERGRRSGCPVTAAPLHLHWRWRKQALVRRSQRQAGPALPQGLVRCGRERCLKALAKHNIQHLLLIDDVVTSGTTLRHTAIEIRPGPQAPAGPLLRGLAFAVS